MIKHNPIVCLVKLLLLSKLVEIQLKPIELSPQGVEDSVVVVLNQLLPKWALLTGMKCFIEIAIKMTMPF